MKTRFKKISNNGPVSLIQACLETGRTHQIRASLEYLGFPLVGDKIYGVDQTVFLRFIAGEQTADDRLNMRLSRQALHAARLVLRHPGNGRICDWRAPLPADMASLMKALSGINRHAPKPAPPAPVVQARELEIDGKTL